MNFLPLWTANVCPIMSGVIIDRRDHVLMTDFFPESFIFRTLSSRCESTNGPFFSDRGISNNSACAVRRRQPYPDRCSSGRPGGLVYFAAFGRCALRFASLAAA